MRLLEFKYDRVSGLLQKLPIALRLQDLQFIVQFIKQEDQPHHLHRGYDLWETDSVETEYCEMLFRLETERSDKESYRIIVQSRPVQMISY